MRTPVRRYAIQFCLTAAAIGVMGIASLILTWPDAFKSAAVGYLLSFFFTATIFLVMRNYAAAEPSFFLKKYLLSVAIRFTAVLGLFGVLVGYEIVDQIIFIFSFIISYICHSLMELYFINKILDTNHTI